LFTKTGRKFAAKEPKGEGQNQKWTFGSIPNRIVKKG